MAHIGDKPNSYISFLPSTQGYYRKTYDIQPCRKHNFKSFQCEKVPQILKFLVFFFKGFGTYKIMQNRAGMEDLSLNPQVELGAGASVTLMPLHCLWEVGQRQEKPQNRQACSTSICMQQQTAERPCLEQGGRQGYLRLSFSLPAHDTACAWVHAHTRTHIHAHTSYTHTIVKYA